MYDLNNAFIRVSSRLHRQPSHATDAAQDVQQRLGYSDDLFAGPTWINGPITYDQANQMLFNTSSPEVGRRHTQRG